MRDTFLNSTVGRLHVIELLWREGYVRYYLCACDCGQTVVKSNHHLMNSRKQCTGSCGCLRRETTVARSTTHGLSHTPEYRVWTTMINRCTNPNYAEFHLYGGRGITVAKPWRKFEKFFNDMGPRPSPKHQLDRERNSEGYSADNCRWVTAKLNGRNKKNTVTVTLHGIQITLADLAEKAGIDYHAAFYRYQQGWSAERIFNTPSRKAKGAL